MGLSICELLCRMIFFTQVVGNLLSQYLQAFPFLLVPNSTEKSVSEKKVFQGRGTCLEDRDLVASCMGIKWEETFHMHDIEPFTHVW